jgi:hypothetical protein
MDDDSPVDALTMRGKIVAIRRARAEDAVELADLHTRASSSSRYLRFFSAGPSVSSEVRRLLRPVGRDHDGLVVVSDGHIIGVASFNVSATARPSALSLWPTTGTGRAWARFFSRTLLPLRDGPVMTICWGIVLAPQSPHAEGRRHLAPATPARRGEDAGTVVVRIPTRPDADALVAAGERDRIAERHSLASLFTPTSVAVVGAGRQSSGVGHQVLLSPIEERFGGLVYPINPHADKVARPTSLPRPGKHRRSPRSRHHCRAGTGPRDGDRAVRRRRCSGRVVLSSGFAESAAEGRRQSIRW